MQDEPHASLRRGERGKGTVRMGAAATAIAAAAAAAADGPPATTRRATTPVREALVAAARATFEEQGYAGAKTREIAARAGTSEVMLFRHFKSKANLFKEAVFQPFDAYLRTFLAQHYDEAHFPDAPERSSYAEGVIRLLGENRKLLAVLINAHNYDAGDIAQVGDVNSLDTYFSRAAAVMRRDIVATGWDPGIDPALAVRIVFGMVASTVLFREWLFPPDVHPDAITAASSLFIEQGLSLAGHDGATGRQTHASSEP